MSQHTSEERYRQVCRDISAVTGGENDLVANLANTAAIAYELLPFSWIGFYRVSGDVLILGPFQGKSACVRIDRGRGVCGTAWESNEIQIVPDVHAFPGHIPCDAASRSEVVIPLHDAGDTVWGVFDIDSAESDDFSQVDVEGLQNIARLVEAMIARGESSGTP